MIAGAAIAQQQYASGRILVKFKPGSAASDRVSSLKAVDAIGTSPIGQTKIEVVFLSTEGNEARLALALSLNPNVEFAEVDGRMPHTEFIPNDPYFANWQFGLHQISAPLAWDTTRGSADIVIAVLDTGVDTSHPDLSGNIVAGWNIYNNNNNVSDPNGHGTLVAGVIAATSNNGIGVASVAMDCKIMPVRIADDNGWAYWSDLADGIAWAADHGARVANASYNCTGSSTVRSAAKYFQGKGGVFVAAAGNDGTFNSTSDSPYVLTVGAVDGNDVLHPWSNTGDYIDVTAPGSAFTTAPGGKYYGVSGTSISAPYVAGAAALILSLDPSLTGSEVQGIIKNSCKDLGAAGWDPYYGEGRINVAAALDLAGGGDGSDKTAPTVSLDDPTGTDVTGTVAMGATANDNVGVTTVEFYVDGSLHTSLDNAPYDCMWDTTILSDGSHTITVVARDAAGNSSQDSRTFKVSNSSTEEGGGGGKKGKGGKTGGGSDTEAPTISILSPTSGSAVGSSLTVRLAADDNVGIVEIVIYVDDVKVAKTTSNKRDFRISSRKWSAGSHTITAMARDGAGNVTWAAAVTVTK